MGLKIQKKLKPFFEDDALEAKFLVYFFINFEDDSVPSSIVVLVI